MSPNLRTKKRLHVFITGESSHRRIAIQMSLRGEAGNSEISFDPHLSSASCGYVTHLSPLTVHPNHFHLRFSSSLIIPTMPPRRPRTRAVKSSAPSPSPTVESRSSSRKGSKKASEEIVEEENEEEEVGDGVEAVAQGVEEEHEDAVEAESEVVEVEDGDTEDGTGGADGGDVEGDVEGGDTEIAESSKMSMADRLAKLKHLRIRMVCPPSILILSSVSPRVVG